MNEEIEDLIKEFTALKKQYYSYKKAFEKESSFSGATIDPFEKPLLEEIAKSIDEVGEKIDKEIELLSKTIRISDVSARAQALFNDIDTISDNALANYLEWRGHFIEVSNCYIKAYDTFETAVNAQAKFQEDIENIATSLVSVMSGGAFAWMTRAAEMLDGIMDNADTIKKLVGSTGGAVVDKIINYSIPKAYEPLKFDKKGPLKFKNDLLIATVQNCTSIFQVIADVKTLINSFIKKCNSLSSKGIGREGGDSSSIEYFKCYIDLLKAMDPFERKVSKWTLNKHPKINPTLLTREFETGFWAGWLKKLKKVGYEPGIAWETERDENGLITKLDLVEIAVKKVYFTNFFWSSEVTNRLKILLDLDSTSIKTDGLDFYVSIGDVSILVKLAESFEPTQHF